MYHLRLCKALSYTGIVSATKEKPDVFVEDKAIADKAIASGYFELVETKTQIEPDTPANASIDRNQLEEMKVDDLKRLAEDMGLDISDLKKKADLIEAIAAEEVKVPAEYSDEGEADFGEGEGSPTMIELQKE